MGLKEQSNTGKMLKHRGMLFICYLFNFYYSTVKQHLNMQLFLTWKNSIQLKRVCVMKWNIYTFLRKVWNVRFKQFKVKENRETLSWIDKHL